MLRSLRIRYADLILSVPAPKGAILMHTYEYNQEEHPTVPYSISGRVLQDLWGWLGIPMVLMHLYRACVSASATFMLKVGLVYFQQNENFSRFLIKPFK